MDLVPGNSLVAGAHVAALEFSPRAAVGDHRR